MSSGGGGFFNRFTPRGGGGGGAPGGHQEAAARAGGSPRGGGLGRGVNHPRPQGPGGGRRGISFENSAEYEFADDDRHLYRGDQYPLHRAFSDAEYMARRNSIFHLDGAPPTSYDARGSIPPPENAWLGHQGADLHPTMDLTGSQ